MLILAVDDDECFGGEFLMGEEEKRPLASALAALTSFGFLAMSVRKLNRVVSAEVDRLTVSETDEEEGGWWWSGSC